MIEYDFICDACGTRYALPSFEYDGCPHEEVERERGVSNVGCPKGVLKRVWSFGVGSVNGAGGSPAKPSI